MSEPGIPNEMDVVVVRSGGAGLVCALVAAVGGLRVLVLEKSEKLGGTSAMSGGAVWVPANHHGRAAGVPNPAEALAYLRATAPAGWRETEDALWAAFAEEAGRMLEFVEEHTPLRFSLTPESDIWPACSARRARWRQCFGFRFRVAAIVERRGDPRTRRASP